MSTPAGLSKHDWVTFDEEPDGSKRQWAEVDFVPSQRYEHKHNQPLRYVGLRILKPHGSLFADGSDRHYHAVVTNLDWDRARLLSWHREKAGTVVRDARDVHHLEDHLEDHLDGALRRDAPGLLDRFRDQVDRVHPEPVGGQEERARAHARPQLQRREPFPVEPEPRDHVLQEAA